MKKILAVDCCIRKEASRTKQILDAFLSAVPAECEIERLVLSEENLSFFSGEYFRQREALLSAGRLDHPRFRYAHQFAEADEIVIAAPFWDLSFPALLKVYIEQVSVDGITFSSGHGGLKGLCRAKNLLFLTSRGGCYEGSPDEMGSRYLDALHSFFGIGSYSCIAADGLDMSSVDTAAAVEDAKRRAKEFAAHI